MKRISLFGALALFFIASLAGCGGGNKLVGTWKGDMSGATATITFNADNTMVIEASNPMTPAQKIKMKSDYKLDGEKLTVTLKDVSLEGAKPEEQAQFKKFFESQLNKSETSTIKFNSDTEVVVTDSKGTANTMKKV